MAVDPHELENIAGVQPNDEVALKGRLDRWLLGEHGWVYAQRFGSLEDGGEAWLYAVEFGLRQGLLGDARFRGGRSWVQNFVTRAPGSFLLQSQQEVEREHLLRL